jgi:hypothetical protein
MDSIHFTTFRRCPLPKSRTRWFSGLKEGRKEGHLEEGRKEGHLEEGGREGREEET